MQATLWDAVSCSTLFWCHDGSQAMQRPATDVCLSLNTDLDSYSRLCNDKGGPGTGNARYVINKAWH